MHIRVSAPILAAILGLGLTVPALSAPLFPDVPENHWAKDAVASLAAKGIVEGYPDGTFKGDRNMSRWEAALVTARLLSKLQESHLTLASKAELEELNKLASALREELDVLGARTSALEAKVDLLDQRVSELERISFYGEYRARVHTMSMRNVGLGSLGNPPILEYNDMVGSNAGAGGIITAPSAAAGLTFNTFVFGIMSVTDWSTGRPMVSGTSISQELMLGTKFDLSKEFEGGAEFSAYSSCGNKVVDAFWGTSQPYLSNPFTACGRSGGVDANNQPYAKLALDNFWLRHKSSDTKLTLGAFKETGFDTFFYVPERNPNAWGERYLEDYGLQLTGSHKFNDKTKVKWEVMATRLAEDIANSAVPTGDYDTSMQGFNAEFLFNDEAGSFKINAMHVSDEGSNGSAMMGLNLQPNFTLEWVNPDGWYVNQLGAGTSAVAGMGSTSDVRPIPMLGAVGNDGITGVAGVPNLGGIGPQEMFSYGFSGRYRFDLGHVEPELYAEYAHSNYKPSKNSTYSVGGNAYRFGTDIRMWGDRVDLNASYQSVDPTYDPYVLPYPTVNGIGNTLWNVPGFTYYNSMYALHDTDEYTHNRKGLRLKGSWKFCPTGRLNMSYERLDQVKTSCHDVRYSASSIAPGTPNTPVLGFSPGFMDPVFGGFSPETYAQEGNNLYGKVLENPVGKVSKWSISAGFKYPLEIKKNKRCLSLSGGARSSHFTRHSNLASMLTTPTRWGAESRNYVNCYLDAWQINIDYDITTNLRMHAGYKSVDIYGHMDHLGVMDAYANAIQDSNFDVLNMEQRIPNLSIDWDINKQFTWGILGQFFETKDRMKEGIYSTPGVPAANISFGPQTGAHPFNWQGYMISSYLNYKF